MTRLEAIRKNAEMAVKFKSFGNAHEACEKHVPWLLELVAAQAAVVEAADLVSEGWPEKWGMANGADKSPFRTVSVNILAVQQLREALEALDAFLSESGREGA